MNVNWHCKVRKYFYNRHHFDARVLETRVAVGGLIFDSKEQVKTAPIVSRLDFRKVITEDGVEVSLEGSINQAKSIANGFSAGIVQCLSTGKGLHKCSKSQISKLSP